MASRLSTFVLLWLWTCQFCATASTDSTTCGDQEQIYTITSQDDADALENCSVVIGSISINVDEGITSDIVLRGVQNITGNLNFDGGARLDSFVAPELTLVGNHLYIAYYGPGNLTLPSLTGIGGIHINDDGSLQVSSFPPGIRNSSVAPTSIFLYGTSVGSLEEMQFPFVSDLNIESNRKLQTLTLGAHQIGEAIDGSNLFSSDNGVSLTDNNETDIDFRLSLPNLEVLAGYNELRNLTGLDLPKLSTINGTLTITGTNLSYLDLPALTAIFAEPEGRNTAPATSLTIEYSRMGSLSIPSLRNASKLEFWSNEGALYNNFTLPALEFLERGYFEPGINITGLNCSYWQSLYCNGIITEEVECGQFVSELYFSSSSGCLKKSGSIDTRSDNGLLFLSTLMSLLGAVIIAGF